MAITPLEFFIVEDEMPAQQALKHYLGSLSGVSVSGTAEDVAGAFDGIVRLEPDAVFLDIRLRGGDAFQLLDKFKQNDLECPPIILMTGFTEFQLAQKALNDYRHKIIKILQKPFLENFEEHFEECRSALLAYQQSSKERKVHATDAIFVKQGSITYRLQIDDIDFIEVGGSGSIILVTVDGRHLQIQQTLNSFMDTAPEKIVKIHRNNAVNIDKISHVDHDERLLFLRGHSRGLSIGRTYYPAVVQLMH